MGSTPIQNIATFALWIPPSRTLLNAVPWELDVLPCNEGVTHLDEWIEKQRKNRISMISKPVLATLLASLLMASVALLPACKKEKPNPKPEVEKPKPDNPSNPDTPNKPDKPDKPTEVRHATVNPKNYTATEWVYYDLDENKVIKIPDDQRGNSVQWDIAFHRTDVRTNSGKTNPKGRGGAFLTGETTLRKVEIPTDDAFRRDEDFTLKVLINSGGGMKVERVPSYANKLLSWHYSPATPNGLVYSEEKPGTSNGRRYKGSPSAFIIRNGEGNAYYLIRVKDNTVIHITDPYNDDFVIPFDYIKL